MSLSSWQHGQSPRLPRRRARSGSGSTPATSPTSPRLPEATPTKMRAGINDLVVVRLGDTVHALHAVCAHAGGPLAEGTIVGRLRRVPLARIPFPDERRPRPPGSVGLRPAELRAARRRRRRLRGPPPRRELSAPRPHPMSTLVLPDPSLVILVGAAGSGKTTLARPPFAPDEIVSSDALRAVVSGNEADQRASAVAFRILHRTVDRRLAKGEMTVVDATNTKTEHRRPLLTRARLTGLPPSPIVLDLPRVHGPRPERRAGPNASSIPTSWNVTSRPSADRSTTPISPPKASTMSCSCRPGGRSTSASNAEGRPAPANRPSNRTSNNATPTAYASRQPG